MERLAVTGAVSLGGSSTILLQRIIYLDQWAWIRLVRAHYGKDSDPSLRRTLDFVRTSRQAGWARFPLSLAHFLETTKHSSAERRRRLAAFMLEISALELPLLFEA